MYDPERALQTERDLIADQLHLVRVKQRCGANHPWTQRIEFLVNIERTIVQKENDLDNCFDDSQCQIIEATIKELIDIAKDVLEKM